MRADSVAVVETGYAIDLPEAQWVERVCETAWAAFGIGEGCFAYLYDASSSELEVWSSTFARGAAERTDFDVASAVGRIKAILPESVIASLYDPAPPAGLASEYIDPDLPGMAELWGSALPANVTDVVGVRAGGLERRGVLLGFPVTAAFRGLAPHTRHALDRVAVHLNAAYRLRCLSPDATSLDSASAVLTADARIEHLGADDEAHAHRGALVDAVRRMQRARGTLRKHDAEESLAEWRALVSGHWSVVDFVDRDGKRFIVARRNEPRGRDLLAITDIERQVLELASLGHPNKLIAYELGLSPAAITSQLRRGLRKLGLANRTELVGLRRTAALR